MSTSALHIRDALITDIRAIAALVLQLNREEGYKVSAPPEALEEVLFNRRANVPMRALLAELDRRVIGLVLYYWGFDTVSASYGYHLADIVVEKKFRNRGIGTQLFNALAEQCHQENGEWISLTVLKQNARAQNFYRNRGMVEVAVNFFAIGPKGIERCREEELRAQMARRPKDE